MAHTEVTELIKDAQICLANNDARRALTLGNEALAVERNSVDGYLTIAIAYDQLNKTNEAYSSINKAINLNPTYEIAHLTRLQIAKRTMAKPSILNICKNSLGYLPNSSQLWYELSQVEHSEGNKLLADQAFKKHLVLSASTPSLKQAMKSFFEHDYVSSEKAVRHHLKPI